MKLFLLVLFCVFICINTANAEVLSINASSQRLQDTELCSTIRNDNSIDKFLDFKY